MFYKKFTPNVIVVCVKTVRRFGDSLDDATKKDYKLIETAFKKFCKTQKNKEHRFVSSPRPFCRQTDGVAANQ